MTEFDAVDLMEGITMHIRVSRAKEMKIRFWIGIKLIKLAAKIFNMGLEINESLKEKEDPVDWNAWVERVVARGGIQGGESWMKNLYLRKLVKNEKA